MLSPARWIPVLIVLGCTWPGHAQTELGAAHLRPNLVSNIERPLRYRPDRGDFVIENGGEFFNRSLYGGHTAFRVDGGDKPEFVLYLPGRGGNLRFGIRNANGAKWLNDAAHIETRYRPGELRYEIRDPLLGPDGTIRLVALAYARTEGLIVRIESQAVAPGTDLIWAFGGVNGRRGKRDGDIGTESVPISQWFQLESAFCRGNAFELNATGFVLRAKAATITGVVPTDAHLGLGDATRWTDLAALVRSVDENRAGNLPVVVGRLAVTEGAPQYLSLQRVAAGETVAEDLATYREVREETTASPDRSNLRDIRSPRSPAPYARGDLPARFAEAESDFTSLRERVAVDTPDPFLNAAVGALNVAADAVWDGPQQAIMHGAIAWRTKLLGWRGPYVLDALGWHDRARKNFSSWVARQDMSPVPTAVPPPDEKSNLARNEAGLHTNGDLSRSHYDMNLVFIDALFRHLQWTGDLAFARRVWPVIERHLAWERRLFRREYGPDKLPLYEGYAAIWASDDLQYSGGGTAHASAYNYYENRQAARLARLLGADPAPYYHEADLIARAMRELLWVHGGDVDASSSIAGSASSSFGWFAEYKDWLGRQRVHPSAALWTFYHTVDSELPTPLEAWQMSEQVDAEIPHLPVRGPGVPAGLCTLATSDWMPYDWSINNVVMAEAVHGALAMWEAGRPDEAWSITKGSLLAAMFMGISPGNVGSMSYLDVYRRESQRDFADGAGVLSRALIEGLFGVKPDALAGEIRVTPGWPDEWSHAALRHPDFALSFERHGATDAYVFVQHREVPDGSSEDGAGRPAPPLALRLRVVARRDRVGEVLLDGRPVAWRLVASSVGQPRIEVSAAPAERHEVTIRWAGQPIASNRVRVTGTGFVAEQQGEMRWLRAPVGPAGVEPTRPGDASAAGLECPVTLHGVRFEPVDLSAAFNDRVTQIFRNEYRAPRSPFVSLAMPKQGIGGWAGGVNRTAVIDDSGLRRRAAEQGGRIVLPDGVPLATPTESATRNVVFTSQWANYPHAVSIPLHGQARAVALLMTGSTNPMQSRFENGEVTVSYRDGTSARLPLVNPTNWWPIDEDYFIDDYQFRRPGPLPIRVDLRTGNVRLLDAAAFAGKGGSVPGGAASVLWLRLDETKSLQTLTVRTTANEVVIGLMAATLLR